MKTGLEYLDWLSKADQVRFLRNYTNAEARRKEEQCSISKYLTDEYPDVDLFIKAAFIWSESIEGFHYWSDLRYNLLKRK